MPRGADSTGTAAWHGVLGQASPPAPPPSTPSLPGALCAPLAPGATEALTRCPSQVLLRSSSPAPTEPMDPSRGLRALTQEEVRGKGAWPQEGL